MDVVMENTDNQKCGKRCNLVVFEIKKDGDLHDEELGLGDCLLYKQQLEKIQPKIYEVI